MIDLGPFGQVSGSDLLGAGGIASSLAGGVTGAIGASEAAAGTAAAYRAQATGYRLNAAIQGENAWRSWFATNLQQQQADYRANQVIGAQRAGYATSGVSPDSGTPLDVLADTEGQIKVDALNRFYLGKFAAQQAGEQYGFDVQSAAAADQAAKEAEKQASTSIFSSILGGITGAAKIATTFL